MILVFEKDYPISRQFRKRGRFARGSLDDIWLVPRARSHYKGHGAVFPKELVAKILRNFSDPGDIIYDPFSGIATMAVVPKELGRNFLGSEINAKYVDFANERLKNTEVHSQLELLLV